MLALQWPARLDAQEPTRDQNVELPVPDGDDFRSFAQELVGAYGSFYQQAQKRQAKPWILASCSSTTPKYTTTDSFRAGSPMHRLLTDATCRLAMPSATLVLYWNIVLWDLRNDDISEIRRFFLDLEATIAGGLEEGGTAESFFWVLITDLERRCVVNTASILLLARLLRAVNKLSADLQQRLEKQLLAFLTGEAEEDGSSLWWHPQAFWYAVLQDLGF